MWWWTGQCTQKARKSVDVHIHARLQEKKYLVKCCSWFNMKFPDCFFSKSCPMFWQYQKAGFVCVCVSKKGRSKLGHQKKNVCVIHGTGIFTYGTMVDFYGINVGTYLIHGSYGINQGCFFLCLCLVFCVLCFVLRVVWFAFGKTTIHRSEKSCPLPAVLGKGKAFEPTSFKFHW